MGGFGCARLTPAIQEEDNGSGRGQLLSAFRLVFPIAYPARHVSQEVTGPRSDCTAGSEAYGDDPTGLEDEMRRVDRLRGRGYNTGQ